MRTLLRALGTKNDARYNLKIMDNGSPAPAASAPADSAAPAAAAAPAADPAQTAVTDDESVPESSSHSSTVVSRTREELADLDDLDV